MNAFKTAALAAVMGLAATPAVSATLLYAPGQKYAERVHNSGQAAGNPITLVTPGGYAVRYTADGTLRPNGNGFAKQTGDVNWLEIDPLLAQVTKIGFTLTPNSSVKFNTAFDVLVTFIGGGSQVLNGLLPSHGNVDIWAEGSELIDSIRIYNLTGSAKQRNPLTAGKLADVRHTSFDVGAAVPSPVPEPAAWAMMIAGFGVIGAALRRVRAGGATGSARA